MAGDLMENRLSRRALLGRTACGFGSLALAGLCGSALGSEAASHPLAPRCGHFPARAKRIIFVFMHGGPSHVDIFDYKPRLYREHGQNINITGYRFDDLGKNTKRTVMRPQWDFKRYGESGRWVSSLFPEMAKHVDDLCFIHSMHTEGVAHGPSTLFLHTGQINLVRPSMGSWISYGLGTENQNMPAFVTVNPPSNMGGPRNYGNAFLPAAFQGTALGQSGQDMRKVRFRFTENHDLELADQKRQFQFLQALNRQQAELAGGDDDFEAAIDSFELAWRMQRHAPHLVDIESESDLTKKMYGIDDKTTEDFGRQCLIARKLSEAGVRFVQINYTDNSNNPKWDQHSRIHEHARHARATDKPVAALLADLKGRGLLEDTLVWWGGEFGRTPFSQNNDGRDHNPPGFTIWLAGGGVKGGYAYGATDEYGFRAERNKVHMHDLHATILHLLGLNHERLTYRHAGRDFRLTDLYGRVVHDVIA